MKLSALTIYILGISLSIVILSFGLFQQFLPNTKEAKMWADNYEASLAEANKMPQAQKRVETAMQMVNAEAQNWQRVVAQRTPSNNVETGGINLAVNPFQLSVDTRKFRNNAQRAVNAQLRRGGVTVVSGPQVPSLDENLPANQILSSYYNFPAFSYPIVIWDFGTVTVQGTYKQISDHLKAFSSMPNYLAVADGLRLEGTSPLLTGTYNLTVVGFIRGNDIFPNAPEGAASGGGGAAGAGGFRGMGGPPMGAPGMGGGPPMMGMPGAMGGGGGPARPGAPSAGGGGR